MGGECSAHGWEERRIKGFGGETWARPLGRPRRRWEDNIKMDIQEVGCGGLDWIELAQDMESWRALVTTVMNLRVPLNSGNFLNGCKPVSFSIRTLLQGLWSFYQHCFLVNHVVCWSCVIFTYTSWVSTDGVHYPWQLSYYNISKRGPGSSVGIATDCGLDGPGIESRWGRDFSHTSRTALRPTQPPVQWVPGLSRG
jgi:hypothetical protein